MKTKVEDSQRPGRALAASLTDVMLCAVAAGLLFGAFDLLFGLNAGGWTRPDRPGLILGAWAAGLGAFGALALASGLLSGLILRLLRAGERLQPVRRGSTWLAVMVAYGAGMIVMMTGRVDPDLGPATIFLLAVSLSVGLLSCFAFGLGKRGETAPSPEFPDRLDRIGVSAAGASLVLGLGAMLWTAGVLSLRPALLLPTLAAVFLLAWPVMGWLLGSKAPQAGRWGLFLIFLAIMGAGAVPLLERSPRIVSNPRPSSKEIQRIVLITIDTLRADALGCYNPGANATPNIDALAARGMRFENAISPSPWTLPSFSSMMTGLPVSAHKVTGREAALPEGATRLAEALGRTGYLTAGFGSNYFLRADRGFARGFDVYRFYPRMVDLIEPPLDRSLGAALFNFISTRDLLTEISTTEIADLSIDWIESQAGRPSFLWCHFFDPHGPYIPPRKFRPPGEPEPRLGYGAAIVERYRRREFIPTESEKAWLQKLYLAEVRYVDEQVGRILRALDETGDRENTLIILASDHGEEFWDHGGFEHGHTLYQELIHVPLIVSRPGSIPAGVRTDVVSLTDLFPTVLDRVGAPAPEWMEGRAWFDETGRNVPVQRPVFAAGTTLSEPQEAVMHEGWKLTQEVGGNEPQLFDLGQDPLEQANLATQQTGKVDALRTELWGWYARAEQIRKAEQLGEVRSLELPDYVLEDLRDLGYIN